MGNRDPGLTQALVISLIGIVMLLFDVFSLGPVVDTFIVTAGSFPLTSWGQSMMPHVLLYGEWFYLIIKIIAVVFVIYPFIYLFRRHKYTNDDDMYDPYWG